MPILELENKSIFFVHIPKTGGTSVEVWLAEAGRVSFIAHNPRMPFACSPQHFTWRDMQFLSNNKAWDYCFTIVRDPYERIESEFAFRYPNISPNLAPINFGTWLDKCLSEVIERPYYLDNHLRPQTDFLAPSVEVFRFEDGVDTIMEKVADRIGIDPPKNSIHHNKRTADDSRFDWSSPLLEKFNAYYVSDFENLGYPVRDIVSFAQD